MTKEEFIEYTNELSTIKSENTIVVCPSYLNIPYLTEFSNIKVGAQNVSSYTSGAHTGEVNAKQLISYGVTYSIIGHSERRKSQKETSEEINLKLRMALSEGIIPILCIGESKEEKDNNQIEQVLQNELNIALKEISTEDRKKIIIAYEPIWSIGTGLLPTNEEIENCIDIIRNISPTSNILYGGSVNDENIDTLQSLKTIDGYLIGGMSLDIKKIKSFLAKLN
jgi:triosephosphate isomerase